MTRSIHLICNAHLDPVWLWEWEEGAAAAISTFRTAADLCEEFGAFIFNHNEVILYRWVEDYEPVLFARIQRLVKEGRWHIMSGWYLQPDCNMPSGEAFTRQILLGRRYFAEKFGVRPTTAINFDPFGHTRGLVQIMARAGYDSYIFCRPGEEDIHLPQGAFTWEGYDGSRVLAVRPYGHYLSALGRVNVKVESYLKTCPEETPGILLWGVGNHGGGPSRADIQILERLIAHNGAERLCHSTPEAYFAEVRSQGKSLPVHRGDINPWAVGCYTSMAQSKYKHRLFENELYATEKMVSAAWAQGRVTYPAETFAEAMRTLATAEFHDILPGSSIQPVEEMALRLMDHGLEILSRAKAQAFFSLAEGQPVAKENEIPILVYNPHPYAVESVVECEFQLADQNWGEDFTNVTAFQGGVELPTQVEHEISGLALDWRKKVAFRARLAPAQMNRFDCRLERLPNRPTPAQPSTELIELVNGAMEVAISTRTGLIESYRFAGKDVLKPGAGKMLVIADSPDPWGMRVRSFRKVRGAFRLLSPKKSSWLAGVPAPTLAPVRVIEDGAVRMIVEALFGWGNSYLVLRYLLPKQGSEIEIEARVHWNEKDSMLKLSLPYANRRARLLGQVAFGVEALPVNGDEVVAQKWLALVPRSTAETPALSVINNRTYGADYLRGELRLTLLRSPGYAAHPINDRPVLPTDRYTPRIDQGERLFHFWLNAGPSTARLDAIDREALAHNEKPMALSFFPNGAGNAPAPFITLSDAVVQLSAVKRAEDGDSIILRLFEPTGQPRSTTITLPFAGISHEVTLKGFEIRTLRVDVQKGLWEEVNLVEEGN
jgi:alpha-mannosidase